MKEADVVGVVEEHVVEGVEVVVEAARGEEFFGSACAVGVSVFGVVDHEVEGELFCEVVWLRPFAVVEVVGEIVEAPSDLSDEVIVLSV